MTKYRTKASATTENARIQVIHRRRRRKTSLRSRGNTNALVVGDVEEHVLERALVGHDGTREDAGGRERAVHVRATGRLGRDPHAAFSLLYVGDAREAAQRGGGAASIVHRDLDRPRARGHLCDRAARDEPALVDHEHAVADLLDFLEQMTRQEDTVLLVRELAHELADLALPSGIEPVR